MAQGTKSHMERRNPASAERWWELRAERNGARPKQVWDAETKTWGRP